MKKIKISMDAFAELHDDEEVVYFVVKTLRGGRGQLREVRLDVPKWETHTEKLPPPQSTSKDVDLIKPRKTGGE